MIHTKLRVVFQSTMLTNILLPVLEAWHPKNSLTTFNDRILFDHIFTVEKYIKGRNHELTETAAIIVFIMSCGHDETRSDTIIEFI
jgi:hypothetical protein